MESNPKYREVARALRERLAAGEFPIGSDFPSISAIQNDYDVRGLNTVRQAIEPLVNEGLLEVAQGRRTRVIALPPADSGDPGAVLVEAVKDLHLALTAATAAAARIRTLLEAG